MFSETTSGEFWKARASQGSEDLKGSRGSFQGKEEASCHWWEVGHPIFSKKTVGKMSTSLFLPVFSVLFLGFPVSGKPVFQSFSPNPSKSLHGKAVLPSSFHYERPAQCWATVRVCLLPGGEAQCPGGGGSGQGPRTVKLWLPPSPQPEDQHWERNGSSFHSFWWKVSTLGKHISPPCILNMPAPNVPPPVNLGAMVTTSPWVLQLPSEPSRLFAFQQVLSLSLNEATI